ncbi:protection of telomeres protein 1-like [Ostrea edulis]|uniref:protection of telomeres protein 1-like n=1 Tax=Ostrea edulis TaxID=37623 RepID=UPI0024AF52FE|nr:protection of telomeres protein 1-like [Ostrea edulis]
MVDKTSKTTEYKYTNLDEIQANKIVNVFGVVKFARPPTKTRGSDYSMVLSVIDPSLHENGQKLKCVLFNREKEKLPFLDVGKIVRLHRLKITHYHEENQGQSGPGFSWLAFDGDKGSPVRPVSSSASFTFTESDKAKVEELREWVATLEDLQHPNKICFADMIPQHYYDIYCQVLATCVIEENVGFLLRVWDGTKPNNPLREFDISSGDFTADRKQDLLDMAGNLALDVALYDDHYAPAKAIKPGQYIKLNNLHAATFQSADTRPELSELPMVELVIHRGTTYGRGVHVISDDFDGIKTLKERLEKVSAEVRQKGVSVAPTHSMNNNARLNDSENCVENNTDISTSQPSINLSCYDGSQERNQSQEVAMEVSCDHVIQSQPQKGLKQVQIHQSVSQQSQSTARCMLQTSTVVLNHPHIQCSKIQDILTHRVPYKFRILAKVVDYYPRFNRPADICKLYCTDCHYLCDVPVNDNGTQILKVSRNSRHLKHYLCPVCNKDSQCELEYIYMMRFLLRDKTGEIVANIWRKDAVTFFQDITPAEMLTESALCNVIENSLNTISNPKSSYYAWFECCVKSYDTEEGIRYQIFDTCFA